MQGLVASVVLISLLHSGCIDPLDESDRDYEGYRLMGTFVMNATQEEKNEFAKVATERGGFYHHHGLPGQPVHFQVEGFGELENCEYVKEVAENLDSVASVGDCHWRETST